MSLRLGLLKLEEEWNFSYYTVDFDTFMEIIVTAEM